MKNKTLFFFVFLLQTALLSIAQNYDLVPIEGLDNYYVSNPNIDELLSDTSLEYTWGWPYSEAHFNSDVCVILDSSDAGLTVYGVASCFAHLNFPGWDDFSLDTSRSNWREYTCLYKPIGDSMLLLGSSAYSQFDQPTYIMPPHHSRIAPYMDSMYVDPNDNTLITPPLFETYFDTAYYVTDSFYFGTTNHNGALADGIHARGLCLNGFSIEYPVNTNIATTIKVYNSGDYVRWRRFPYRPGILLAFPILTPDPNRSTPTPVDTVLSYFDTTAIDTTIIDTTGQGGDTTGVDTTGAAIYSPQLLERYTQLIPSVVEVGGTATVLSSFHLQAVELYDAAGRLVQSRPARGTAATVDCTALPRGSYLVRLVTTAGTTTKKLTVR